MKLNRVSVISLIIFFVAIAASIFIQSYAFDKRFTRIDQSQHFYDMKKHYESGKLPVTSARFMASRVVQEAEITPRVPGGAYYLFYTLFYKMSSESLSVTRFINVIFNMAILGLFLFWFYKRFGAFITSIITALVLCNGYAIAAITDFWNPNLTLIFSFLLFICLYEYVQESKKKYSILGSIFAFPILAIMAQAHFVTFFTMIPTLIVYLLFNYKKTKKYIVYWGLGVFISFLLYLPYLIVEIQNGFNNTNLIFATRSGLSKLPLLQMHAMLLFPTNEMSVYFGNNLRSTIVFWLNEPAYIIGIIFLISTMLLSIFFVIKSIILVFNRKYIPSNDREKALLEMCKIFLLFIPVGIIVNILSRSKPGTFHYLYSGFALSYTPVITYLVLKEYKIKNNAKILYLVSIFIILNTFSMTGQLTRYFKRYEEPRNQESMKMLAKSIFDDSKGNDVTVYGLYSDDDYMYRNIAIAYFPEYAYNEIDNSTNIYIVVDTVGSFPYEAKTIENNKKLLASNATLIAENTVLKIYKLNSDKMIDFYYKHDGLRSIK